MSKSVCTFRNCFLVASKGNIGYCSEDHMDRGLMDDEHAAVAQRRVLQFVLQIYKGGIDPITFLRCIDKNVPIPYGLEGGDGKGALYNCLIAVEHKNSLVKASLLTDGLRIYNMDIGYPFQYLTVESDSYTANHSVTSKKGELIAT